MTRRAYPEETVFPNFPDCPSLPTPPLRTSANPLAVENPCRPEPGGEREKTFEVGNFATQRFSGLVDACSSAVPVNISTENIVNRLTIHSYMIYMYRVRNQSNCKKKKN